MSAVLDTVMGVADSGIPSRSLLESDYLEALVHLGKAQTECTEAVSRFLAIQAEWKRVASEDACAELSVTWMPEQARPETRWTRRKRRWRCTGRKPCTALLWSSRVSFTRW